MIHPRYLIDLLSDEPFKPFRLHLASGRMFDVRHPEMIEIGKSVVTVYAPPDGDSHGPDRWRKVSLTLLESIESLESPAKTGNGAPR